MDRETIYLLGIMVPLLIILAHLVWDAPSPFDKDEDDLLY